MVPPRSGHSLSLPPLSTPSSGVSSPKALPRTACHRSAGSSAATPCASLSQLQTTSRPGGAAPASEAYWRAHRRRLPIVSSAWTNIHSGSAEGSPFAVAVRVDTSGGSSSTGSPGCSALLATQCVPKAGEYRTAKALLLAVDRGSLSNDHRVRPSGAVSRPTRSIQAVTRRRRLRAQPPRADRYTTIKLPSSEGGKPRKGPGLFRPGIARARPVLSWDDAACWAAATEWRCGRRLSRHHHPQPDGDRRAHRGGPVMYGCGEPLDAPCPCR